MWVPRAGRLPVINMPVGFSQDGLPMGMQIIGGIMRIRRAQLAYAYEQPRTGSARHLPALIKRELTGPSNCCSARWRFFQGTRHAIA